MNSDLPELVISIEARLDKFEKAIDEKFKPALAKAIGDVVDSFLADCSADFVELKAASE